MQDAADTIPAPCPTTVVDKSKSKDEAPLTSHDRMLEKYFETYETPTEISSIHKNPSRNALCPCGSGKKFKKCCLVKPRIISTPA